MYVCFEREEEEEKKKRETIIERKRFCFSVTYNRVLSLFFFFFLIDKMYKYEQHAHICATNDVKLLNHESIHRYVSALPVIIG